MGKPLSLYILCGHNSAQWHIFHKLDDYHMLGDPGLFNCFSASVSTQCLPLAFQLFIRRNNITYKKKQVMLESSEANITGLG